MFSVKATDYPQSKEWDLKINSTPSIPGGKNLLISNLRLLLIAIKNNAPLDQVPQLIDSNSSATLNDLCVHQLSAMNFVTRTNGGNWKLTKESELWLSSEDNLYLATLFCANIKFFSEILYYLDSPKTARNLFDIAVNDYDMAWKTQTTINGRLIWLRQFGLITFQEFSLLYSITDLGRTFLEKVGYLLPEEIITINDPTLSEDDYEINPAILSYYSEKAKTSIRKTGLGYFPDKLYNIDSILNSVLLQLQQDNSIESFYEFAKQNYNIIDSSAKRVLFVISTLGLIQRQTNTSYVITDLGHNWLESQDISMLLPLFQLIGLFFLEILGELKQKNLSSKELATLAKISYGFDKENVPEINRRLSVLKKAGLVMNLSAEKYSITHRGQIFLEKYSSLFDLIDATDKPVSASIDSTQKTDIISELRMASKDSFNPNRFEKAVRDFFEAMGFKAEWLGGAGRTDVLLSSLTPPSPYVVTVDAKATSSSSVTDALVDFDTLTEHKKKHRSNYVAVVGRGFNERVVKRAIEHNVALFDVDTLEELFTLHQSTPQKSSTYKKLFEQKGIVDLSVLTNDINSTESLGMLITSIMHCLISECSDPFTKGKLTVRELYQALRKDNPNLFQSLNEEQSIQNTIESALTFLSSPILGCITKEKEYYYATGSIKDLTKTLGFLIKKCNS